MSTTKSPKEWAEVLKYDVITIKVLDRTTHSCELNALFDKIYRIEHRKNILLFKQTLFYQSINQ
jgi:DNA replication protein DnaC